MDIEFKRSIFTSEHIIIKKRKSYIIIPLNKIDKLYYAKSSFINGFFFNNKNIALGYLYIYLNEKIQGNHIYAIKIKYSELIQVPENILNKIEFYKPFQLLKSMFK